MTSAPGGSTPIDPQLLDLLRCPLSHEPLVQVGDRLLCYASRRAYRIEDGIPVMLAEESEELSDTEIPPEHR
ncbi:MAG: Trm112 family protein [Planctomycetota bacterium]